MTSSQAVVELLIHIEHEATHERKETVCPSPCIIYGCKRAAKEQTIEKARARVTFKLLCKTSLQPL